MSLINKMLQDLDHRRAMAGADQSIPPRQVRAVEAARSGHEWFWRIVTALMLVAVGWAGWIVYQLQLQAKPLATELAYRAADEAKARRPVAASAPVPGPVTPPAAPAAPPPEPPAQAARPPGVQIDSLKLAHAIETPITERGTRQALTATSTTERVKPKPEAAVPAGQRASDAAPAGERKAPVSLALDLPAAHVLSPPHAASARVTKRDRLLTAGERAEAEYRRAVALLNQGRGADANEGFAAALAQDPAHEGARQARVALLLEQRELDAARRLLQEGLAINPAQPTFAVGLARILLERREHAGALAALDGAAGAGAGNAEFQVMRATVLQRLGRHGEAAEAYQAALRVQAANPQAWIGLGMAFEAQARKPQAVEAFRRALAAGPVSAELRDFAEQRVRALQ